MQHFLKWTSDQKYQTCDNPINNVIPLVEHFTKMNSEMTCKALGSGKHKKSIRSTIEMGNIFMFQNPPPDCSSGRHSKWPYVWHSLLTAEDFPTEQRHMECHHGNPSPTIQRCSRKNIENDQHHDAGIMGNNESRQIGRTRPARDGKLHPPTTEPKGRD